MEEEKRISEGEKGLGLRGTRTRVMSKGDKGHQLWFQVMLWEPVLVP